MLLELVLKTVFEVRNEREPHAWKVSWWDKKSGNLGRRDLRAVENNGIKIFAIASREIVAAEVCELY